MHMQWNFVNHFFQPCYICTFAGNAKNCLSIFLQPLNLRLELIIAFLQRWWWWRFGGFAIAMRSINNNKKIVRGRFVKGWLTITNARKEIAGSSTRDVQISFARVLQLRLLREICSSAFCWFCRIGPTTNFEQNLKIVCNSSSGLSRL
jgi:hypothetical protein